MKSKTKSTEDPWQISAARYCVESSEKGFTKEDLNRYIEEKYKSVSRAQLGRFFEEEIQHPTGREYPRTSFQDDGKTEKWIPTLDLVSKITDFDELREARCNARQAFWLSLIAIIISAITLIVSFRSSPDCINGLKKIIFKPVIQQKIISV